MTSAPSLRVVMLSYWVTEESGGPGIAAAGFAAGLARLGAEVVLVARENLGARWLVDEGSARRDGYRLIKVAAASWPRQLVRMVSQARAPGPPTVLWVNGIWGVQSVAALWASGLGRRPYVVRPAGSLGLAALRHKQLKKRIYFGAVESHVVARARALHCMSDLEVAELPAALRARAFVVPSGVDLPEAAGPGHQAGLVGVLARLHPIKNHQLALDAVERLVGQGRELRLELAGSTSDPSWEDSLRRRVAASPVLRDRVAFLGHVEKARLPAVVGRWRAALLLSEQENFGHAVVAAAALGVPTIVSPGVGLGAALEAAGAGRVVQPGQAHLALAELLDADEAPLAAACRGFAARFSWAGASAALLARLAAAAGIRDIPSGGPTMPSAEPA